MLLALWQLLLDAQGSGILCLMDIAGGMEHLHTLGVLHVRAVACSGHSCMLTMSLLS